MNTFLILANVWGPLSVALQVLTLVAGVLLILVVLFQDSKGGGLEAAFGGGGANMGSGGSNRRVLRITAIMASIFVGLVLIASLVHNQSQRGRLLDIDDIDPAPQQRVEVPETPAGDLPLVPAPVLPSDNDLPGGGDTD